MSKGDRAAVHIDPLGVEPREAVHRKRDNREGLIDLKKINLANAETLLLEELVDRFCGRGCEPLGRLRVLLRTGQAGDNLEAVRSRDAAVGAD